MARPKSVKVEEKTVKVVEQNEPETETNAEVDSSLAEEATNAEINSVDGENCENGENGEVVWVKCVEGGEPEIVLWQTKPEEDLPTDWAENENEEEGKTEEWEWGTEEETAEEETAEETEEESKVNLTSWVASTVVNDPICGNRAVFQPQVSINNYQSTDTVARGENARRGEIIKRC